MQDLKQKPKYYHPLIWFATTYTVCLNQWHKQRYKAKWLFLGLLGILLLNWLLLDIPIRSYYAYNNYMPFLSFIKTKQAPNSESLNSTDYHILFFDGDKHVEFFKCNNLRQAQGVHVQLSKSDLIPKAKQKPINQNIIPSGYVPYRFNSLVFGQFQLLSKQTLVDGSIAKNPNYYNNFYTIPTNIAQSGLYAQDDEMYREALEGNIPRHLKKRKNLVPFVGPSPYTGDGSDPDDSYLDNEIQDSPNYIQGQLIKKLKSLPRNYHLDFCIYLHYDAGNMPDRITYAWAFFNDEADGSVTYHEYKLPILHYHVAKKYFNYVNISVFPPGNTPDSIDTSFSAEQPGSLFDDGTLSWQILLHGYHLTIDNDYLVDHPFANGSNSCLPINLQRYTVLQNYFKDHKQELLQVKMYSEIALLVKSLLFLLGFFLFDSLFGKSMNRVAHKKAD